LDDNKPGTGSDPSQEDDWRFSGTPKDWPAAVEQLIEEAIRDGKFSNLPGHGRPLNLQKNPFAGDTELAYQLLKDNDFTLPWIAGRKRTLNRITEFRDAIQRSWLRHRDKYQVAGDDIERRELAQAWHAQLDQWREEIEEINALIGKTNLTQPGERMEILKLTFEDELRRAGARRELG
jgi:DnaJ family protein C protein 28